MSYTYFGGARIQLGAVEDSNGARALITSGGGGGGASGPTPYKTESRVDNTGVPYDVVMLRDPSTGVVTSELRRTDVIPNTIYAPVAPTRSVTKHVLDEIILDNEQAIAANVLGGVALTGVPAVGTFSHVVLQIQGDDITYGVTVVPTASVGVIVTDSSTVTIDAADVAALRIFSLAGCSVSRQFMLFKEITI